MARARAPLNTRGRGLPLEGADRRARLSPPPWPDRNTAFAAARAAGNHGRTALCWRGPNRGRPPR
eukprot:11210038-Lingulodinium_polyedra.AAC.1